MIIFGIMSFAFGLGIGSFLNMVIWRLHTNQSFTGRSRCPNCRQKINWYDNIPLLSFLILKGRCRSCGHKISWQYPLVELATAILFAIAFFQIITSHQPSAISYKLILELFRNFIMISFFIIIFVYDWRWYLILDAVIIPASITAFILNLCLGGSWANLLIGGIIGSSFFMAQYLISRGRWIGGGDIRLGFLLGVMFGWQLLLVVLFIAYIMGAIFGVGLIVAGKKKLSSKIPFGTFLSAASIIAIFYGTQILNWYLNKII